MPLAVPWGTGKKSGRFKILKEKPAEVSAQDEDFGENLYCLFIDRSPTASLLMDIYVVAVLLPKM